jgi:OmpA-OmpF porin, OOP family
MRQFAFGAVCLTVTLLGCGGAQTSSAAAETTDETGSIETAKTAETQADAPDPAGTETEVTETPAAEPAEKTAAPATAAPTEETASASTEPEVKEAISARITDKHIVISGKILFETGKAKLREVSYEVLDEVVFALEKHPEIVKLQVLGHTDSDGNAKANKRLSRRRAAAVMKYLIRKGIEKDRISAVGVGEDIPIADNAQEAGKEKNRRVEFVIVERAKVHAVYHSATTVEPGRVDSRKATDDEIEELIKKEGLDKKF